jgi:hypothetical protein
VYRLDSVGHVWAPDSSKIDRRTESALVQAVKIYQARILDRLNVGPGRDVSRWG